MGKKRPSGLLPIFLTPLFFILCTNITSLLFLPSVSQAGIFSKEKKPEEIARKYGEAVVLITTSDKDGKALGGGSGFIVDPKGIVVTNFHCIDGADNARIRLKNGAYFDMEGVLGVDQDWDIAVLRIKAKNLPSVPLGDSDKLSVGERIVAIGNPLGLENTVSEGIISAIRGFEDTGDVVIQFTAPISPGSSGGPLFNTNGQVIGVTTLYLKEGQNLNFAVPINHVKMLLKDKESIPIAHGRRATVGKALADTLKAEEDVNPEAERYLYLGLSFFGEGKVDSAIGEFKEALSIQPDNVSAHTFLGFCYKNKGLYELAIKHFQEAIRLNPNHIFAHASLGETYLTKGLYESAIRECEEAIKLKPDLTETTTAIRDMYNGALSSSHFTLGVIYSEKGLDEQAIRHYEEAIRFSPDLEVAHFNLGLVYDKKGQHDLAIKQYEEAIRLKSDYAEAHLNLGVMYGRKGKYDLEIKQYKEALKYKPDYALAHYNLGISYNNKGQHELAIRHLEQALQIEPDYTEAQELLDKLYQLRGWRSVTPYQQSIPASQPAVGKVYHLSNQREFHRPSCSVIQGKTNLREFKSRAEAIASGGKPCSLCNP